MGKIREVAAHDGDSSTHHNIEIGGVTTSKARALMEICGKLGLELSHDGIRRQSQRSGDARRMRVWRGDGEAPPRDIKTAADFGDDYQ